MRYLLVLSIGLICLSTSAVGAQTARASIVPQDPPSASLFRQRPMPQIRVDPQAPVSAEEETRIEGLIADLDQMDQDQMSTVQKPSPLVESFHAFKFESSIYSGDGFAPLAWSAEKLPRPIQAFRELVQLGPRAMPFLLAALDDKTPTRITFKKISFGGVSQRKDVLGNPLNAEEQRVLAASRKLPQTDRWVRDQDGLFWRYTATVGDLCFVALGQIVGRPDELAPYPSSSLSDSTYNSNHDPHMIRTIWSSDNPAQHLFDSLLLDFSTEGTFDGNYQRERDNGRSRRAWETGSDLQIAAAERLLYYFPRQAAPLIAERLHGLRVDFPNPASYDACEQREAANGVKTGDLLLAVDWCREPAVRAEMLDIFRRTTVPDLLLVALSAVDPAQKDLILERLKAALRSLSTVKEQWGYVAWCDDNRLLAALGQRMGEGAKPIIKQYLENASVERCTTICCVLRELHCKWDLEVLLPLLDGRRPDIEKSYPLLMNEWEYVTQVRVCDAAACTLARNHSGLHFRMVGTPAVMDQQVAAIKQALTEKGHP